MTAPGGPLLSLQAVKKHFPVGRRGVFAGSGEVLRAVDGVTLSIESGQTLGLVGESGSGKSTLAACVVRLHTLTAGSINFEGRDISRLSRRALRPVRRDMQMIFQNPYASLNPAKRVGMIVGDPLRMHGSKDERGIRQQVSDMLSVVGLNARDANRFPHEFSGGQRQRIAIARALILRPKLVVADEPLSALDTSIQAQVLNLLQDLQHELHLTYLFISHDLSVVRHVSGHVAVMYLGKIMEVARADDLYARPMHPYTVALLSAAPIPEPGAVADWEKNVLEGDMPSPISPPSGCRFRTRCPFAAERCVTEEPVLAELAAGHLAACHYPLNAQEPFATPGA